MRTWTKKQTRGIEEKKIRLRKNLKYKKKEKKTEQYQQKTR